MSEFFLHIIMAVGVMAAVILLLVLGATHVRKPQ
ncbi:hypothetical protein J2T37_001933 [Neisseria perflava]|nr:hypothetical protein [Neisseria perflava]MCP1772971.1 hypothetical protein [Neisseria perflava]